MKNRFTFVFGMILVAALIYFLSVYYDSDFPPLDPSDDQSKYTFSENWMHDEALSTWPVHLEQFAGQPDIAYLEIGVFEGRSFFWMLENVLTNRSSRAWAVDIFWSNIYKVFNRNLEASGRQEQVVVKKGYSKDILREFSDEQFDIIYIDASHLARDTLRDSVLAWDLLKVGGVMIFDDYEQLITVPIDASAKLSVDTFITAYGRELEVLHRGYQVLLKKTEDRCGKNNQCVLFGNARYYFYDGTIENLDNNRTYDLSEADVELLSSYLQGTVSFGEAKSSPPDNFARKDEIVQLFEKYQLRFE